MVRRRSFLIAVLLVLAWTAPAGAEPAAGAAGAFLKLGMDARTMGLGGAATAVVGEASAAYWNPAGLAAVPRQQLLAAYTAFPGGGEYSQLVYALPFSTFGFPSDGRSGSQGPASGMTLALSLVRLAAGYAIEARRVDSLNPDYLFSDIEGCYGLAGAWALGSGWSVGMNLKGLYHLLDRVSASGGGVDLGAVWQDTSDLTVGLQVRDAYTRLDWPGGVRELFPPTGKLGASYARALAPDHRVLVCADAEQTLTRRPVRLRAGAEYGYAGTVFARAGYNDGFFTAGGGLRLPGIGWGRVAARLDYAALQDAITGWDHWLTVSLEF